MSGFSDSGAFSRFARSVISERRFIHSPETHSFFDEFLRTAEHRVESLFPDHCLFRAQKGSVRKLLSNAEFDYKDNFPFPTERMKPLADRAREGRANPKGIPFLYLATRSETAIAEIRPWKCDLVSLGEFRPTRELRVVNATTLASTVFNPFQKPRKRTPEEVEEWVWGTISHAFSRPTELADDTSDYVPTQVLAELLRAHGYHGIGYASGYGDGHNIAIFDTSLAAHVNCRLVQIQGMTFEIDWDLNLGYEVPSPSSAV